MSKITPEKIVRRWNGTPVVVAATGPSLSEDVAARCRDLPCVAVNDAHRLFPWADVLYAADMSWWRAHKGCPDFKGDKYVPLTAAVQSRAAEAELFELRIVDGVRKSGFSFSAECIHLGGGFASGCNSGLQAMNLALLMGGNPLIAVGFDVRAVDGKQHFFGQHPRQLNQRQNFASWLRAFDAAAESLPDDIEIINCTPGTALECFPQRALDEVLDGLDHRHAA